MTHPNIVLDLITQCCNIILKIQEKELNYRGNPLFCMG